MREFSPKSLWSRRLLVPFAVATLYAALAWRYDQWRGWHKTGTGTSSVEWFAALGDLLRVFPFGFFVNPYGNASLLCNAFGWALLCFIAAAVVRKFRPVASR
jgi:hypothetical protein